MSININELKKRQWPKSNFPIGQEVLDRSFPGDPMAIPDDNLTPLIPRPGYTYSGKKWPADYLTSCFVPPESVVCLPLPKIPHGSSAIQGLLRVGDTLCGVAGGENAYGFTLKNDDFAVYPLASDTSVAAAAAKNGIFFALLTNGRILSFDGKECLNLAAGVRYAATDGERFGGILANGKLFIADPVGGTFITSAAPCTEFSPGLALGKSGLYGASDECELFHWDGTRAEMLNCHAPSLAGRQVYNRIGCLILTPDEASLWGGTSEDGVLFECVLNDKKVKSFGKPLGVRGISALLLSGNTLFGLGGIGCRHVFRRNQQTAELTDDGLINVSVPRSWCLYEAHTLAADGNGGIWIGEAERISHLFQVCF